MTPGAEGTWAGRLVDPATRQELAGEVGGDGAAGSLLLRYHEWQAARWPRLTAAMGSLSSARTRDLPMGQRVVRLQHNPGREASTTALVADHEVAARPCFLCPQHLPPEERGLPDGPSLVWLANPAPILPLHFTIAHREHRRQELLPILAEATRLATSAAGKVDVFYNGPRCGASAPDHLHLQGVAAGRLPDCQWAAGLPADDARGRGVLHAEAGLRVFSDRQDGRFVLVFRGVRVGVERGIREALALRRDLGGHDGWEPPCNLVLSSDGRLLTALLYLRGRHRPSCYFAEEPDLRIVSPGAVDMAGLVVAVRGTDFERLDASAIRAIFEECSLDPVLAGVIEERLGARLVAGEAGPGRDCVAAEVDDG